MASFHMQAPQPKKKKALRPFKFKTVQMTSARDLVKLPRRELQRLQARRVLFRLFRLPWLRFP